MKINFEKTIKADRDKVFEIVANYENFQELLPQHFPSIRVRSKRDNISVVEEHIRIDKKELVMMTKHILEPPTSHKVFVIGGDAKGSTFTEEYHIIPRGTRVTVHADIKLGGLMKIAELVFKKKIQGHLTHIMDEFADIAESTFP